MIKPPLKLSTLVLVATAIVAGIMLFRVSAHVQRAEDRLALMEHQAAQEAESIRVLRAEWDYLNRPERLEVLAHEYLEMNVPAVTQIRNGGDTLPVPPVMQAQPVTLSPAEAASVPRPRIKPRRDTQQDFRSLLNSIQKPSAAEGRE